LCHAVFHKLKKAHDAYELLTSSGAGSDTDATPFQGDAFGTAEDYASDTFGQAVDNDENLPPLMEVSDDEDDDKDDDKEDEEEMVNMVAELEKSWELPREGAPHQDEEEVPAPPQEADNSDDNHDKGHAQHQCNTDRFIIRDGYGVKPAVRIRYNDKYPSACTGQPLTHQESRDYVYSVALGGGDNPWAAFNSKKDWEIARWAKLRGAGSMAFSELLAIDGVRFN